MRQLIKKFNSLGILIIVIFYLIIALQYQYSHGILKENAENLTNLTVTNLSVSIDKWLLKNTQVISDAADFVKLDFWTDKQLLEYLKALLKDNTAFSSIYFGSKDNAMINASGWIPPEGFDLTVRPWYVKAAQNGKLVYTDVFLNASKDALIITIAIPVYDVNNQLLGVVGGDVYLTTIIDSIAREKLNENGFSFLLDSRGNLLAHSSYKNINRLEVKYPAEEYQQIVPEILDKGTGFIPMQLEGKKGLLAFVPLKGVEWYLASFIWEEDYAQLNEHVTFNFVISTLAVLFIFVLFVLFLRKYVKGPILELEKNISYISMNMDASFRLPESKKDVFASLVKTINELLTRIEVYFNRISSEEEQIRLLNESLRVSEERWQFAILGSGDGVWDWNIQTGHVFYSERWKEIFDVDDSEIRYDYTDWEKRVHPEDLEIVLEENYKHFRNETELYKYEYRIICKDGTIKWILARGKVVSWTPDGKALRMVGTHSDITERKEAEYRISYLSYHDSLTGLYNRAYFEEQLKLLDESKTFPISIVLCDANGLKMVNDAFGHEEGDRLLNIVSGIFKKVCRKEDIVARVGGDEFAIIMTGVADADASGIIGRIKEQCNEDYDIPIKPSIAVGVAVKSEANQDIASVYRQAENRMYKNKLMESKSARSSIISSLKTTLQERTHETEAHSNRLMELSLKLGRIMGLHENMMNDLELLAMLHDIGKVAIPDYILDKPGPLTEEEWDIMKKHSEIGYRIAIASSELTSIADGILSHHERWDGKGYNQGLKGIEIPLISRIVSIVDAYDAMTNDRTYRKAMTGKQAVEELEKCSGTQFDPEIVKCFIAMLKEE